MRVRLYMTVQDGHDRWHGAQSELWTRLWNAVPVAPQRGERIEIWRDGPTIEVKERWFNHAGHVFCDLRTCVIDPDADEQRYQSHDTQPRSWSWFSKDHPNDAIRSRLIEGGWTTTN